MSDKGLNLYVVAVPAGGIIYLGLFLPMKARPNDMPMPRPRPLNAESVPARHLADPDLSKSISVRRVNTSECSTMPDSLAAILRKEQYISSFR